MIVFPENLEDLFFLVKTGNPHCKIDTTSVAEVTLESLNTIDMVNSELAKMFHMRENSKEVYLLPKNVFGNFCLNPQFITKKQFISNVSLVL